MIAPAAQINQIDLECAERMADFFRSEVAKLPENSELKRPLERGLAAWEKIAETIEARQAHL